MNDGLETGLRHRLQRALRRMESQHEHLRPLFADVEGSLVANGSLREPLIRLHDALHAHFDLEDEVLFPALRGLSPGSHGALEVLCDEHRAFLADLRGLADARRGSVEPGFRRLREALGEHERREEGLLQSILQVDVRSH